MSAYEQRIEPPDKSWQYLLFAAEPYETIAFKVCSLKIVYEAFAVLLVLSVTPFKIPTKCCSQWCVALKRADCSVDM